MPFADGKKDASSTLSRNSTRRSQTAERSQFESFNAESPLCLSSFSFTPRAGAVKISTKRRKMTRTFFSGVSSTYTRGEGESDKRFGERPVRTWKMAVRRKFLQLLKFFASAGQINRWLIMEGGRERRIDGRRRAQSDQKWCSRVCASGSSGSAPPSCSEGILLMSFRHEQEFVAHTLQSGARKLIIGCTV